jgi:hypothetical protein
MLAPVAAQASVVNDLLNQVGNTVNNITGNGSGGSGGGGGSTASPAPTPQSGTPPTYVPPQHGTVPTGQGTVGVVDVTPENTTPLPGGPADDSEDATVGGSRGEQNGDGSYHGHVSILTLLGIDVLPTDTNPGETDNGPLGPLNDALDNVCTSTSGNLCLNVLDVNSKTTNHGSSNSFSAVDLKLGSGNTGIAANVASSEGNISDDGTCQTADGSSGVANANVLGITANAFNSSSKSTACNDGSSSQKNSSQDVVLNGNGLGLPAAGCADGTANSDFTALAPLLSAVCNADQSGSDPFGVREALSVFVLDLGGTPLAKATAAAAESHAVPPPSTTNPPPVNPPGGCSNPPCGNGGPNGPGSHPSEPGNGGPSGPNGPNGPSADSPGKGNLPFTGTDLVRLALIGLAVTIIGLTLMGLADRRRRFAQAA